MTALYIIIFLLVGFGATATVLTRNPLKQTMVMSLYGLLLTILFVSMQGPDVAFSELVVGSAAIPLMVLIALHKMRGQGP